jgi:hypothetical protein
MYKPPKSDTKYYWTQHVVRKMLYYGISADKIKRIIRYPERTESAIAPDTIGVMQRTGAKKNTEIWVMFQTKSQSSRLRQSSDGQTKITKNRGSKKIIISAWRYPGISQEGKTVPIPPEILEELKKDRFL